MTETSRPPIERLRPVRRARALTLIEMLVALAILGLLIGLLLPAVQKVREAANRSACANNLKQLGLAVHHYHDVYGQFPPARIARHEYATWPVLLLPYVEQQDVYREWVKTGLGVRFSAQSPVARKTEVKTFFCPSRLSRGSGQLSKPGYHGNRETRRGALGGYAACAGDGTAMDTKEANGALIVADVKAPDPNNDDRPPGSPDVTVERFVSYTTTADVLDGTSRTLLIGEKHVPPDHFGDFAVGDNAYYSGYRFRSAQRCAGPAFPLVPHPTVPVTNPYRFGSWHPGVCQFVFVDGSVRALANNISTTTLRSLAVRNDGKVPFAY